MPRDISTYHVLNCMFDLIFVPRSESLKIDLRTAFWNSFVLLSEDEINSISSAVE